MVLTFSKAVLPLVRPLARFTCLLTGYEPYISVERVQNRHPNLASFLGFRGEMPMDQGKAHTRIYDVLPFDNQYLALPA